MAAFFLIHILTIFPIVAIGNYVAGYISKAEIAHKVMTACHAFQTPLANEIIHGIVDRLLFNLRAPLIQSSLEFINGPLAITRLQKQINNVVIDRTAARSRRGGDAELV